MSYVRSHRLRFGIGTVQRNSLWPSTALISRIWNTDAMEKVHEMRSPAYRLLYQSYHGLQVRMV
jgi:hypothetical protein